ncbi:hypothetical protein H9P43_009419 [Blastocladiella emersonii ATCC 22665]|nr:hypothetical protein H9P43_009419 [Blastocladiella emersonii ATCC 22665]
MAAAERNHAQLLKLITDTLSARDSDLRRGLALDSHDMHKAISVLKEEVAELRQAPPKRAEWFTVAKRAFPNEEKFMLKLKYLNTGPNIDALFRAVEDAKREWKEVTAKRAGA